MTIWLKQSTAATLLIGPFLDDGDGKSAETGLTISQGDVRLSKNAGNMAQKNESTACTHDELGYYTCPLDATDTNTLGVLKLMVHESGALPVWVEAMVVPANVWDSMFSTDKLQVHVDEMTAGIITATVIADNAIDAGAIAADAITAAKIADDAISSEHLNTGAITADAFAADAIVAATLATGAITADAFAADAIVAATLATDAITDDAIATGAIASTAFAAGAINAAAIADNAIDAGAIAADAVAEIADAVWDEVVTTGAHDTDTFAGKQLLTASAAGDPWATAIPGAYGAGTAGLLLGTTIPGAIDTIDNFLDTEVAAVLEDTGTTLPTTLATIDGIVDDIKAAVVTNAAGVDIAADIIALKAETVSILEDTGTTIPATLAGFATSEDIADAVWDEAIAGHSDAGSLGKAVTDTLEDTGTTLDTLIKDIPTNAELTTALGTADDATLALIATKTTELLTEIRSINSTDPIEGGQYVISWKSHHTTGEFGVWVVAGGGAGTYYGGGLVAASSVGLYSYSLALTDVPVADNYVACVGWRATAGSGDFGEYGTGPSFSVLADDTAKIIPSIPLADFDPATDVVAHVTLVDTTTTNTDMVTDVATDVASILEDTGTTLDTLVKDIPTNAELATALGTADDAVLAAVAAVKAETASILEDTGTTLPASLAALDTLIDSIIAAVITNATGTDVAADIIAAKVVLDKLSTIIANKSIENEAGTEVVYRNAGDTADAGTQSWDEATKTRGEYTAS